MRLAAAAAALTFGLSGPITPAAAAGPDFARFAYALSNGFTLSQTRIDGFGKTEVFASPGVLVAAAGTLPVTPVRFASDGTMWSGLFVAGMAPCPATRGAALPLSFTTLL